MHCLYSILLDQHTTFYLSTYCWGSILLSHLKQFVDIMTFYHEKVWCVFFKDKDILVFSLWHSGLKIWCCLWHRLQLLLGFDPWPRNLYMCHTDTQTDTQTQTHTDTQTHRHTHTHTHTHHFLFSSYAWARTVSFRWSGVPPSLFLCQLFSRLLVSHWFKSCSSFELGSWSWVGLGPWFEKGWDPIPSRHLVLSSRGKSGPNITLHPSSIF